MNKYYELNIKSLKDTEFKLTIGSKNQPLTVDELIELLNEYRNYEIYIYGDGNGAHHVRVIPRENKIIIYE